MLCLVTCRSLWQDQELQLNLSLLCSQSWETRLPSGPAVKHWLFGLPILFAGES